MKAVGRPQKWTKMWRSGRKYVGARYGALHYNCFPVKPKRIWPVPEPHLLVVCYSAVDFESFREVEDTVVPEVTEAFPSAPLILVATKCDLKDNSPTSSLHEEGRTIKVG